MRRFPWFLTLTLASAASLVVGACSSSESSPIGDGAGGEEAGAASETGTKPGTEGTDSSVTPSDDAATKTDSSTGGGDSGCTPIAPSLDAGGGCGSMEFGAVATPFTGVDAGGGGLYAGGVFAAGVYDAVLAERASGNAGSWRETFVSDGNGHFTRIRQIDTGSGGGPGPVSRRSGTYAVNGTQITFTYGCAQSDGTPIATPGSDTLPYEVVTDKCDATYRYGATGIRVSLRRR
jgi:hypothetical protein